MASCKVGPAFPKWIQNQIKLAYLVMSDAGISDSIPNKFWDLPSTLISLDLSMNQIHGELPNLSSKYYPLDTIDLSSNRMSGPLSPWPLPPISHVLLSQNMFSGVLSSSLCATPEVQELAILDLSENRLSGELPNCWVKFQRLLTLNLAKNNFSGKIPSSLGYLRGILLLQLHDNNFSGELPSLENCTNLIVLDLGSNKLSGNIPEWVGQRLTNLTVLRMQSNEFYGSIPSSLCSLPAIHVLDLSQNNISGLLTHCLNNITFSSEVEDFGIEWGTVIQLMWKGVEREFGGGIEYLRSIDNSSNYLTGDIPEALTSMPEMTSLNPSGNNLTGVIPRNFGQLKKLEFLDLSRNQLSGSIPSIPTSFSSLNRISVLNLSFNNMSERIPRSRQLDTFQDSSFTGNVRLCGPPLTRLCPGDGTTEDPRVTSSRKLKKIMTVSYHQGFMLALGLDSSQDFWESALHHCVRLL